MSRSQVVLLAWVVILALSGCQSQAPIVVMPPPTLEPTVVPTPGLMRVYVSGAVTNPNKVYQLPLGSIGEDAVNAAGGATNDADLDQVNLAEELHDQDHFHMPRKTEPGMVIAAAQGAAASAAGARININTATVQELDTLPKIGPATAQQIVDYRSRNGPFQRKEDIMQVPRIGQATFDQIKDLITIGD
jgi:competence protein ComEA